MKAWVLHDVNDIRFEEIKEPSLAENEVLVAVKAAGICGSDIPRTFRDGAHNMPLVIGHEFSGQVVKTGKRVGVFPLLPCKNCIACQKRQYEMCRNYGYLGSRRNGGFAEYVAVPEWNLIELPDSVSYEEAAMLEPMAVAVHAMRRGRPRKGDLVVICGLGTIGLMLMMFLLEDEENRPKKILAVGNKEFQKQTAIKMGLPRECYCDSRNEDVDKWLAEHSDGNGVDVFFECVGKNETVVQAVDNTAPAERIVLTGNPYSDMGLEKSTYWKILRNQLMIMGTWNSSFTHQNDDDWHYVLDRLSRKRVFPKELITHRLPLANLERGLHIMRDKTEDYIKVMGLM